MKPPNGQADTASSSGSSKFWARLGAVLGFRSDSNQQLRDTLEEIIGETVESENGEAQEIGADERVMLSNILKLRHLTAYDVMVPRADIVSAEVDTPYEDLIELFRTAGHSRLPVYRESLDDLLGMIHVKDTVGLGGSGQKIKLSKLLRPVDVIAPSMPVMDLLLQMRLNKTHMVLVVDEFGGIDGLVTIEDLVEEIVGEIEDEYDVNETPKLIWRADGTLLADARLPISDFETEVGEILSEEEREEDIDTLGGLVFYLADRVPARGELIEHEASGAVFEVVQADPRRIKRLRVRKVSPARQADET